MDGASDREMNGRWTRDVQKDRHIFVQKEILFKISLLTVQHKTFDHNKTTFL